MKYLYIFLFFITICQASLKIEITKGIVNPEPIVVIPFLNEQSFQQTAISSIVSNDLKSSGAFNLIDPNPLPQDLLTLSKSVVWKNWSNLGCHFLLRGEYFQSLGTIRIKIYLYDIINQTKILASSVEGNISQWRKLAHRISDLIYSRITGESGFFDSQIVFSQKTTSSLARQQKSKIMIMDQDGFGLRALTKGKTLDLTPNYAPNGQSIAYLSYEGKPQIKLLDLCSHSSKPLFDKIDGMTFAPSFSPDGNWIAFSMTDKKKGTSAIYLKNLKTNALKQLTKQTCIDTSPCFSPDGSKIVFTSDRSGTEALYVMNSDGSNVYRISGQEGKYSQPSWSPRGDLITFTKQVFGDGGGFYIGVMAVDGKEPERMIESGFLVECPRWSPNGRYILFQKEEPNTDSRLVIVDITGRFRRNFSILRVTGASWSPLLSAARE